LATAISVGLVPIIAIGYQAWTVYAPSNPGRPPTSGFGINLLIPLVMQLTIMIIVLIACAVLQTADEGTR
jgi:hypothetical protein